MASGNRITVTTGMLREERVINWNITQFSEILHSRDLIRGQQHNFQMGSQIDLPTKWHCYLSTCNWLPEPESHWIGIYFQLLELPENVEQVYVSYVVDIKNQNGLVVRRLQSEMKNMVVKPIRGFQNLLYPLQPLETFLVNGELKLEITFSLWKPTPPVVLPQTLEKLVLHYEHQFQLKLTSDLNQPRVLCRSYELPEMTIVSRDYQEYVVNRGLLAARTKGFPGEPMDPETGKVYLKDFGGKTVDVLLKYINVGTLHPDWKEVEVLKELIIAVERFELGLLKEFLDEAVGHLVTLGNAMELGVLVSGKGMGKAESRIFGYLMENARSFEDLMLKKKDDE